MTATKSEIEAAFATALDEVRATLHRFAETLGQDAYRYDMDQPMRAAHDMLSDFRPYVAALEAAEEENTRLARAEKRDLYRNSPVVI